MATPLQPIFHWRQIDQRLVSSKSVAILVRHGSRDAHSPRASEALISITTDGIVITGVDVWQQTRIDGRDSIKQVVNNCLRKIVHEVKVTDRMELAMYLVEYPIQDGIPLDLDKTDARPPASVAADAVPARAAAATAWR